MDQTALTSTWTLEQYKTLVDNLIATKALSCIKVRDEYTLLLSVITPEAFPTTSDCRKTDDDVISDGKRNNIDGVNSVFPMGNTEFTPTPNLPVQTGVRDYKSSKSFLVPFDRQMTDSLGSRIKSFKSVRSEALCLNIGFDTEFEVVKRSSDLIESEKSEEIVNRRVLSLQASVQVGELFIRYFFVINPNFQTVTKEGGKIPIAFVLADILNNLREFFPDLPKIHNKINWLIIDLPK
jgi:hypothetical protein